MPIIERLLIDNAENDQPNYGAPPRALILAPTRELVQITFQILLFTLFNSFCAQAKQIVVEFSSCTRELTTLSVYGGTPYYPQEQALRRGVDVVIGTPGRIMDLIQKGTLKLTNIRFVVLDEVDEMLNMGFQKDVDVSILMCFFSFF